MIIITCTKCGKKHKLTKPVVDFGLPKVIVDELMDGTLSSESSERWKIINKQYFLIKALISLPVREVKRFDSFSILVWITVSRGNFIKYIKSLEENSLLSYKATGILTSEIYFFKNSSGLEVTYEFRGVNNFPLAFINDLNTDFSKDQRNGWNVDQVAAFIESIHHYDGSSSDDSVPPSEA